jgi:predicted acetyltransferase
VVEIRELDAGDLAAWARVAAQAYRRGDMGQGIPVWPEGDFTRLGLIEEGRQVAQFHLWHYEIFFGEQRVPMGGVASVACLPLARGKGYVEALLARGLEQMRERGEVVSALHAFLVGLYRPMGWEWVGSRRSYTLPLAHLPAGLDTRSVRAAGPEDAETLKSLYEAEAARYRGTLIRPLSWWKERLEATSGFMHYFFLYADPEPKGYLYLQLREPARVRELIARSPAAYAGLLGVLRRHKSQLDQVVWDAPPDDPLWHTAAHWEIETKWRPPFSSRVVDVPAALALRRPDPKVRGQCRVQVTDRLAPWNEGCWEIAVEDGGITAQRTSEAPQMGCDIGAWSQLFFGDPDADALRRAGRLTVSDERGYTLLRALCPPALCWTNDGF